MEGTQKKTRKSLKYCCVCKGIYRGKSLDGRVVSLHRFPQNKTLKRVWLQRCKTVMKSFRWNENKLLCSEHFVDLHGPTKLHTLPSIFPTAGGDAKHFPTSSLDENQEYDMSGADENSNTEHSENSSTETQENNTTDNPYNQDDIAIEGQLMNDPLPVHLHVPDAETMMDVSIHLHDYCEGPVPKMMKTHTRSSMVQTYIDARNEETQTPSPALKTFREVSCQTDNETADKAIQCSLPVLTYEDVKHNDELLSLYTGIPNNTLFEAVFDEIKDKAEQETSRRKLNYTEKSGGRPRSLSLVNEFFMVLMRLRLGLLLEDLSSRFCMSSSHCSDIINRWVDYLSISLSFLVQWPSQETIKMNMPKIFRDKFPDTRIVIDCTEVYTETPSSLKLKSLMYSDYKSHMTYKALVGISPNGVVTFVSDLWCGSISDKQITELSGLLNICSEGDAIMADKGFTITDMTTPRGIKLIIPPFKKKNVQFTQREVLLTKDIACCRIHVEREMERIKNFRILMGNIPITMAPRVSKVFKICTYLTALQPPLVQD